MHGGERHPAVFAIEHRSVCAESMVKRSCMFGKGERKVGQMLNDRSY